MRIIRRLEKDHLRFPKINFIELLKNKNNFYNKILIKYKVYKFLIYKK